MEDNKKKLINEKITGRKMTAGRLVRFLLIALFCGLLFGAAGACAFVAVTHFDARIREAAQSVAAESGEEVPSAGTASNGEAVLGRDGSAGGEASPAETLQTETSADAEGTEETVPSGETAQSPSEVKSGETGEDAGHTDPEEDRNPDETGHRQEGTDPLASEEDPGRAEDHDAESSAEDPAAGENREMTAPADSRREDNAGEGTDDRSHTETDPESGRTENDPGAQHPDGKETAVSPENVREELYEAMLDVRRKAVETAERSVVEVQAISMGTTWFESTAEASRNYAGLVIDATPEEYLVLTAAGATETDTVRVVLRDGRTVDAYVKQSSLRDSLAVIGVPRNSEETALENAASGEEGNTAEEGDTALPADGQQGNENRRAESGPTDAETLQEADNAGGRTVQAAADSAEPETDAAEAESRSRETAATEDEGQDNTVQAENADSIYPIAIGNTDNVYPGQPVIAVGAPLGVVRSYDFGEIGLINRDEPELDASSEVYYAGIHSDIESGTFVIDQAGALIGIAASNSGSFGVDRGLTRIISVRSLQEIIESLKAGHKLPFAGLQGFGVSADMMESGLLEGMYVMDVSMDSPAYNIGIKRGDIVTGVREQPVTDMESFKACIRSCAPGDTVDIIVMRGSSQGEYREIRYSVTLAER